MMILGAAVDLSWVGEVVKAVFGDGRQFSSGAVFAGTLSIVLFWLAGKERVAQAQGIQDFHKQIVRQNQLKDERINQLHKDISVKNEQISELQSAVGQLQAAISEREETIRELKGQRRPKEGRN